MKVFILEDDPARIAQFLLVGGGHDMTITSSVEEAQRRYAPPYDLMLLDHDLGGEVYVSSEHENTGAGFCRWLASREDGVGAPYVLIHSFNRTGAERMRATLADAEWPNVACYPFGKFILDALKLQCLRDN